MSELSNWFVHVRVLTGSRVYQKTLLLYSLRISRKEDIHISLQVTRRLGRVSCLEWLHCWMCSKFQMSCRYKAKIVSRKPNGLWCMALILPTSICSSHLCRQRHPHSPIHGLDQNSDRQNHCLSRCRSRREQRLNRRRCRSKGRIRHGMDLRRPGQIRPTRASNSREGRLRWSRPEIQRGIRQAHPTAGRCPGCSDWCITSSGG